MNFDELGQQIEKLHSHLAALRQHTDSKPACQELFQTALKELQAAFAGLVLAQEERHQQHEEIAQMAAKRECQIANQEPFDLVQTPAKLGSFEWDLQTNIVVRSKELQALYGLKPGEFGQTYEDWTKYVHPDDLTQVEIEFQKSLITSEWFAEFRVIWPDGSIHWLQVRAKVFFDEAGKPLRMIGIDEDITERKLAESALQESEQRYRILAEALPQLVWSAQVDGIVDYCNQHWCEYSGLTLEQSQGAGWLSALHPDDQQRTLDCWRAAAESGTSYSIEYRFKRAADSMYRWFFARVTPIREQDGRITKWIGVATDIDERKQTEAALRESEAKFRSLIQNSSDIISILNQGGTIRYVSPSVTRILGYKPEEMLGKNVFEFIHAEDSLKSLNTLSYLIQTEGTTTQIECRVRRQDGSWCFLESTSSNLLVEPSVIGIVINSRDLTERKVAEERLLHEALYDALTGLPNRTLFIERLQHAVEYAKRHEDFLFAVLFLDLDRFKFINDSLGHSFGDQFLLNIAGRLRKCLRSVDVAARLGGDEFTILLEGIRDISDAAQVA
ncbi:MAG: PAS domain-containing protein, partial [Chroococcidiopsidaceae cyanobacterium CP_BM_RX_35]|nr:PAS domain-containing protein [Chroococcidiopsidaceae cyanobacterium CP_BM_RX_35]